jgi:glycosyltransferase involved in cell wall biosynthesis
MSIEVSVITPTYNRRAFLPALLEIYKNQTFPKDKMEWIILDDGSDKVEDVFLAAAKTLPNIRYHYEEEKMRIGAKRNWLNQAAKGSIIVAMDDDDYYPPDRVATVVQAFKKNPRQHIAGSSEMYLYYLDTNTIYGMGPYHPNHATNGTMAWRKSYADAHRYDEYVTKAEETSFLERYTQPMIQLDPKKTILVICHGDNTVDKHQLRQDHLLHITNGPKQPSAMRQTTYKLEDFVKEPALLAFYKRFL